MCSRDKSAIAALFEVAGIFAVVAFLAYRDVLVMVSFLALALVCAVMAFATYRALSHREEAPTQMATKQ